MGIQRPQVLLLGQKANCSRLFAFELLWPRIPEHCLVAPRATCSNSLNRLKNVISQRAERRKTRISFLCSKARTVYTRVPGCPKASSGLRDQWSAAKA
jgi:hypothetical protein